MFCATGCWIKSFLANIVDYSNIQVKALIHSTSTKSKCSGWYLSRVNTWGSVFISHNLIGKTSLREFRDRFTFKRNQITELLGNVWSRFKWSLYSSQQRKLNCIHLIFILIKNLKLFFHELYFLLISCNK